MNDWKAMLNNALIHFATNWRTSLSSILTVAIAMGVYCSLTPTRLISQPLASDITFVVGGLKVLLGFVQRDAK